MGLSLVVEATNIAVPLVLTVTQEGVGGVTGQAPVVALRSAATPDSYLDFADNQFKTGGWTTKYALLGETERGTYQTLVDMTALVPTPNTGDAFVAEYGLDSVVGKGADQDVLLVVALGSGGDTVLLRKALTNRMEETPGNPGTLILFDDDGITPLLTWQLRDAQGGPIVGGIGAPARRSAAT
jgi:hypothetical protein